MMAKKVTAIVFLIIIFIFGIGTVLRTFPAVSASLYLSSGSTLASGTETENRQANKFSFDKKSINRINSIIDLNVKGRNSWIDLNGGFQRGLGMTYVRDPGDIDVYKLDNGQLIYNLEKQDMKWYIRQLSDLDSYAQSSGNGPLLYVQLPFKVENDSLMPAGVNEYGNDNADELLAGASKAGITTLDIRQLMHEEKIDFDKAFISTDQHWTPQTARWAADRICSYARNKFNTPYDGSVFDPSVWNTKSYKNWFLGSLGKRTGRFFGGVSDFDILSPKMKTDFTFRAKAAKGQIKRSGNFEKALLVPKNIETRNLFELNSYATYIGGDYKINTVTNRTADNGCSVLLVRDSFSCAMQPFLCMNYKKVTAIDLRHYNEGTLKEHLADNKYDLILVVYNPSAFSKEQFTFE